ncbi:unnamed protein product [Staurois parvus]|uniref:Uncharacterized protein n=1 Tax=Staurois parvus TaxID=386267 RepID=A0ABN9H576_9NEOB|nr:unnamed protein product [Staurois parvus]
MYIYCGNSLQVVELFSLKHTATRFFKGLFAQFYLKEKSSHNTNASHAGVSTIKKYQQRFSLLACTQFTVCLLQTLPKL